LFTYPKFGYVTWERACSPPIGADHDVLVAAVRGGKER
jgi:hypothetical protein